MPETGRWRFMDKSLKDLELKMFKAELEDLRQQYEHQTLPPNHPITKRVRGIVSNILEANNLGVVKGESSAMQSIFSFGSPQGDTWDPDSGMAVKSKEGADLDSNAREWELIVVDDNKTVNAAALPGM